jgi:hypothetical protein
MSDDAPLTISVPEAGQRYFTAEQIRDTAEVA